MLLSLTHSLTHSHIHSPFLTSLTAITDWLLPIFITIPYHHHPSQNPPNPTSNETLQPKIMGRFTFTLTFTIMTHLNPSRFRIYLCDHLINYLNTKHRTHCSSWRVYTHTYIQTRVPFSQFARNQIHKVVRMCMILSFIRRYVLQCTQYTYLAFWLLNYKLCFPCL